MALRSVATTDTLDTFRTTFNSHATDTGDLATLTTSHTSTLVGAVNEIDAAASGFTLRDSTSTTQVVAGGDILNVAGVSNQTTAVVSATDTVTIGLASTISGLTSVGATTITDGTASISSGSITGVVSITGSGTANFTTDVKVNSVSVATKPFAIAQAVALG